MGEPIISRFLTCKAIEHKVPLSGTFELSPCCNLNCRMCYVRKSREEVEALGGEIEVDKWLELAKELRSKGMLFLLLTGGEPFLYKDFEKLYTELSKMGFVISINTNGTMIDEKTVEWLKKNPPTRINMTLYGATRDTYERLCGVPEAFDKAVKALNLLKDAGICVKVNSSITPYNYKDLEEIHKIAEGKGIFTEATAYMFPPVRRNEEMVGKGERFNPEEAGRCQVEIEKLRLTEKQFYEKAAALNDGILKYKNVHEECGDDGEGLSCRAGRCAFWVNWKGEMTACGMFNHPKYNVFDNGVDKCWKEILDSTEKIHMPKECTTCKIRFACYVCGAMVMAENGNFDEPPKYLCRMTEEMLKIYKEELEKHTKEGEEDEDKEGVH